MKETYSCYAKYMNYSYSYLINFPFYNFFHRTKVKENTTYYVLVIDWKV